MATGAVTTINTASRFARSSISINTHIDRSGGSAASRLNLWIPRVPSDVIAWIARQAQARPVHRFERTTKQQSNNVVEHTLPLTAFRYRFYKTKKFWWAHKD